MKRSNDMIVYLALWGDRWKRIGNEALIRDAAESRDARLVYTAQIIGRVGDSAKDLTAAELRQVIARLRSERPGNIPPGNIPGGKVVRFPNRNLITQRQIWKIRQVERYLGWASRPERLAGFLRATCRGATRPERLGFRVAIGVIDGLVRLAARERVRRERGDPAYRVSAHELAAAVEQVKGELASWQPAADGF